MNRYLVKYMTDCDRDFWDLYAEETIEAESIVEANKIAVTRAGAMRKLVGVIRQVEAPINNPKEKVQQ